MIETKHSPERHPVFDCTPEDISRFWSKITIAGALRSLGRLK